jgi:hypothetical protein
MSPVGISVAVVTESNRQPKSGRIVAAVEWIAVIEVKAAEICIKRIVEAVEVSGIRVRSVIVPVVFVIHLFFDVAILVVLTHNDVAVIYIVSFDSLQTAVLSLENGQLGITPA